MLISQICRYLVKPTLIFSGILLASNWISEPSDLCYLATFMHIEHFIGDVSI